MAALCCVFVWLAAHIYFRDRPDSALLWARNHVASEHQPWGHRPLLAPLIPCSALTAGPMLKSQNQSGAYHRALTFRRLFRPWALGVAASTALWGQPARLRRRRPLSLPGSCLDGAKGPAVAPFLAVVSAAGSQGRTGVDLQSVSGGERRSCLHRCPRTPGPGQWSGSVFDVCIYL